MKRARTKIAVAVLAAMLLLSTPSDSAAALTGPANRCRVKSAAISAQTMESARSFTIDSSDTGLQTNTTSGYGLLTIWTKLTDANTSITRFDITCTVSNDANTTDFTPQVCDDTLDGICTQTDAGKWQKASPGSVNWPTRMDIEGFPDIQCTFDVGSGTGAAADLLTVDWRLCVK